MSIARDIMRRTTAGLLSRLMKRSMTLHELDRLMDLSSVAVSASGATITGDTAVNFSAYFSGVSQICQTIASCDTELFRREGEFKQLPWRGHPVYRLLSRKPNPLMNAFTWKEISQYHAMIWGNAYSYIQRDAIGRPVALWPLNPERVTPSVDTEDINNPALLYEFRHPNGTTTVYTQDQIWHMPGFGFDGIKGYSLLRLASESIGLGLSQQEFSGRFLSNGAHLGGLIKMEKSLSEAAHARLGEQFKNFHAGVSKAGAFAILEEGMDFTPLGMPLADAQFLESKVFQIGEIARFLNISPYKLKDYSRATFSNIEHLGIEYATDTIRPWAERWEASMDTQLLSEEEQELAFTEFDLAAIQRGDFKSQQDGFNVARNGGWMNADEIRYRLGLNPIEDDAVGTMYWRPKNMADASLPDTDAKQGGDEGGTTE